MDTGFTVKSAEFKTSISEPEVYQSVSETYTCPEICVVGRSNVGKSSFINLLAQRKKLAKTSSSPGRTRLLNLFDFNAGTFILVDLPGYGYAEAAKKEIARWGSMIEGYFAFSQKLKHAFALVDIRHEPSALDKQMIRFLYESGMPFTVIATKADKISKAAISKHLQMLASGLGLGKDNIIPCSAETLMGRDALLRRIGQILEN